MEDQRRPVSSTSSDPPQVKPLNRQKAGAGSQEPRQRCVDEGRLIFDDEQ